MVAGGPSGGVVGNGGGACKNPWRLARGKWFPVWFCRLLWGEEQPAGRRGPWWGKISEADGGGRAAPDPGLRGRRCRVSAGLESEGRHLVLLVTDAQCEVMQGAVNDSVGAVIKRPERRYGSCGGGQRAAAAVWCLVEVCSAALSVLENCSIKIFES